jgi:flagellar hook-basal body complex protein FliE
LQHKKHRDRYEKENRKLYLYIIELFKQFFRPTDSIEYSSITRLLKNAPDELNKLQKSETSIKQLLQAKESQSLEDVVSQYFFETTQ